ncbi:MAG TPA: hypothetical protein VFI95_15860 [Terriglobales bacterium]|nr:hypothetical protein [Terriglobales bacterium]
MSTVEVIVNDGSPATEVAGAISGILADLLLLDYDLRAASHRVWLECRGKFQFFSG